MSSRYICSAPKDTLADRFNTDVPGGYKPSYNIAPSHLSAVITQNAPQGVSFFYWGTSPKLAKNKPVSPKLYHVHAEYIPRKTSLQGAIQKRRCIMLADGYYEWKNVGKKRQVPYRVAMKNGQVFAIAGIWEEYEDENDEMVHTCSMITVPANPALQTITDRMPAILSSEAESIWLNKNATESELLSVLKAYPSENMQFHTISPKVNDIQKNSIELLKHTPAADQFGNYTLFS